MNEYATLAELRDRNLGLASANTSDDETLLKMIQRASRSIDRYTRRKFYPRLETRFYDHPQDFQLLRLDDDLLELQTFKTMNGACTVASGVMWLGTGAEWNFPPYDRIVLDESAGSVLLYSGTPRRSNEVTGFWGYHEEWSNAWIDTGTSLAASYAASSVSISLAGAGSVGSGASDVNGDAPRIAPGDTLRIGDQFFAVLSGGTSGNGTVSIKPYLNGTSGTSAAVGASIAKFSPEPDIKSATLRLSSWLYGQKDSPYQTRQVNPQFGTIDIAEKWPPDVLDKLERFKRFRLQVFPGVTR